MLALTTKCDVQYGIMFGALLNQMQQGADVCAQLSSIFSWSKNMKMKY